MPRRHWFFPAFLLLGLLAGIVAGAQGQQDAPKPGDINAKAGDSFLQPYEPRLEYRGQETAGKSGDRSHKSSQLDHKASRGGPKADSFGAAPGQFGSPETQILPSPISGLNSNYSGSYSSTTSFLDGSLLRSLHPDQKSWHTEDLRKRRKAREEKEEKQQKEQAQKEHKAKNN